jgi:hypothetical protein
MKTKHQFIKKQMKNKMKNKSNQIIDNQCFDLFLTTLLQIIKS